MQAQIDWQPLYTFTSNVDKLPRDISERFGAIVVRFQARRDMVFALIVQVEFDAPLCVKVFPTARESSASSGKGCETASSWVIKMPVTVTKRLISCFVHPLPATPSRSSRYSPTNMGMVISKRLQVTRRGRYGYGQVEKIAERGEQPRRNIIG